MRQLLGVVRVNIKKIFLAIKEEVFRKIKIDEVLHDIEKVPELDKK